MKRSWSLLFRAAGPLGSWTARGLRRWCSKMTVDPFPNAIRCVYIPGCSYHVQALRLASVPASSGVSEPVKKEEAKVSAMREGEESFGLRLLKFVGWMGGFYSRKAVLVRSSKTLYENCMDNLNYEEFFKVCSMPDSFQSWFMIAHLHVWFFMVRLKREGKDGEYLIRQVVATFWHDVEHRMRAMEIYNSVAATKDFRALVQQFYGLTLAYEEGLLSDDKLLAAAIWRNMIFEKADTDPTQLAKMVDYIRRQVHNMDKQDTKALLEEGCISLLPFSVEQS